MSEAAGGASRESTAPLCWERHLQAQAATSRITFPSCLGAEAKNNPHCLTGPVVGLRSHRRSPGHCLNHFHFKTIRKKQDFFFFLVSICQISVPGLSYKGSIWHETGAAFLGENRNGTECRRQTMTCYLCSFHLDSAGFLSAALRSRITHL